MSGNAMKSERGTAREEPSTLRSATEMNLETTGNLGRTITASLRKQMLKWSGIITADPYTLRVSRTALQ